MGRPSEQSKLIRDLHLDELSLTGNCLGECKEVIIQFGNGIYHKNDGLFLKDMADLLDSLAGLHAISKWNQSLLEDGDQTAKEIRQIRSQRK